MDVPCVEGTRAEASAAQGAGDRVPSGTTAHVRLPAVAPRSLERPVRLLVPAQRPGCSEGAGAKLTGERGREGHLLHPLGSR